MAETEDDMISRLQALLGEEDKEDIYETPYNPTPPSFESTLAPEEQYFTDSDEYESLTRDAGPKSGGHSNPEPIAAEENSTQEETVKLYEHTNWDEYNLELGMLATDQEESFCPWQTIKKYPYFYIGKANREKVVNKFFDKGKLEQRTWDFFYLHRLDTVNSNPILLVPTSQFEHFLGVINKKLQISLSIPLGNSNGDFYITFENDGTPRPRYLGRSATPDMASEIRFAAPPKGYLPKGEAPSQIEPTDRSLEAFKAKLEKINRASKGRRNALKDKAKANRIVKQQEWRQAIKRVERYLGLRDISRDRKPEISNRLLSESQDWVAYGEAVKAELGNIPPSAWFDPEMPASFEPEDNVVFVCVDVEAYERDIKKVTEIGIATLDMEDIKNVAPGVGGENWFKFIRGRHFRINEYKHLENSEFVQGCADRFEFGESEFISIKDAAAVVATCFRPPYSKPGEAASEDAPKRNLVLVGHDVDADINFLRGIGYDVLNLNLKEKHDTASLYRYLRREQNPRNLGHILGELKIIGWNLHNAGNDAVYTLQAMIGISITHIVERAAKYAELEKEKQLQEKIDEAVKEAKERTLELNEGWSSGGEDSDGGAPVAVEEPDRGQKKLGPGAGSLSRSKGPRNSTSGNVSRENDGSFTWKAEQPPASGRGPHSGRQGGRGHRGDHGNRGSMDTPWRGSGRPKTTPHSTKTSLPNSHQNNKNNGKFNGKTSDKNDDKPSAKEENFDGWW